MRRLFIIRKDLNMSTGKLLTQFGHCVEAYWFHKILNPSNVVKDHIKKDRKEYVQINANIEQEIWDGYIQDIFTKTVLECKNLNKLNQVIELVKSMGFIENTDYGLINDCCKTELTPENSDGTTTTGMWIKPLDDETARTISRSNGLKLYGLFDKR